MRTISRRDMLRGSAAAAAGASALGFAELFNHGRVFAQANGDDPTTILNLADTAETLACLHYYTAIQSRAALQLTDQEVAYLTAFLDAELKHKQFLEANGAQPLATSFYTPANLFSDRNVFVTTTDTAESWFVAAYLAAIRRFAELNEPLLAATVGQIMGVEAEHQALIRQMGGLPPSNYDLKQALFFNTSEVQPQFTFFLQGGNGFAGPTDFPGVDAITALVGGAGVRATPPFTQLTADQGSLSSTQAATAAVTASEPTAEATGAATAEPASAATTTTGDCTVAGDNAHVRQSPNTSSEVVGSLTSGQEMKVIGQTTDAAGATWYQVGIGWVRADVVTLSGDCSALPAVTATP